MSPDRPEAPGPSDPAPAGHEANERRELPGHIQASIDRMLAAQHRDAQGRPADSAGVAWQGRDLTGPGIGDSANPLHVYDTDDGTTDPAWTDYLDRLAAGEAAEREAVAVLEKVRVFAAVVPTLAEESEHVHVQEDGTEHVHHGDKQADVALISLESSEGRKTLPVFTSVPALTSWHPQARPVAVDVPRACLSAVDEGCEMVVIDPGAERTFVLRRPMVWALGQGQPWTPSYEDQELAEEIASIADLVPGLLNLGLAPGSGVGTRTASGQALPGGGTGPELRIVAMPRIGTDEAGVRLMVSTLRMLLADLPLLKQRADSLEVTVRPPNEPV